MHVIDDDEAVRNSLAFLLETRGPRGPDLRLGDRLPRRAAGRLERGCVVTDVRMPDMTGIELVRRLQGAGGFAIR